MELGRILKDLRKSKGLKQEDIAERFGINRASVSYWERGITTPSIETLHELAEFYKVSIDYLLGYAPRNDDYEVLLRFKDLNEELRTKTLGMLDFLIENLIRK